MLRLPRIRGRLHLPAETPRPRLRRIREVGGEQVRRRGARGRRAHDEQKDLREPLWEVNATAAEYFRRSCGRAGRADCARVPRVAGPDARGSPTDLASAIAPRETGAMRGYARRAGFDDDVNAPRVC